MPRICQFYGIVIAMFYNDHDPPHFHAIYGEHRALVGIDAVRVIAGSLPARALRMVFDWARSHQDELRENWRLARERRPLLPVEPLE